MFSYIELARVLSQNLIFAMKTSVFSLCSVKHCYIHRFARLISRYRSMFSYSPIFYQETLQRLVVRCISICHAVIRHLQESKLTRDMMVMKAVTAWCCRVRSAAPEIQFPTEQRGSILYSFLLYPLHKIFSHFAK